MNTTSAGSLATAKAVTGTFGALIEAPNKVHHLASRQGVWVAVPSI